LSRLRLRSHPKLGLAVAGVLAIATAAGTAVPAGAAPSDNGADATVRVVSSKSLVSGHGADLGADVTAAALAAARNPQAAPGPAVTEHNWKQLPMMNGVVHDIDFATKRVGYAAAELGVIYKTTNGGKTWTQIVNVGFPLYFYGVQALSKNEVVVSGFDNSATTAVVWRSTDGGTTWNKDIAFDGNWGNRVEYTDRDHALMAGILGSAVWSTKSGGETEDEWTYANPDPEQGWIGNQITLLPSQRAYISGVKYCTSDDGGVAWGCQASVDPVFDGATSFVDEQHGWVGAGSISPDVEGWIHRTTDGGATWSDRVLDGPWPIRHIEPINDEIVWAGGGNVYSGVGGLYYSADGGQSWDVDLTTGYEMGSCDQHGVKKGKLTRIWCVGFTFNGSAFVSQAYRTTIKTPA
jgi:photosystem II stability/assembly factor-like uncharacterized protein